MANISKMRQDLKDLEESVDELPEEFKDEVREEIKILKEQIALYEKQDSANDKLNDQAEKKIAKLEKVASSPKTTPKVAAAVKKNVAVAKKKLQEAKKEDTKERGQKAREVKSAVAKAKSGQRGRPKKAAPPKKVVKRKSKAEVKYKAALSSLEKLVNRTAELKALYKGKGVDLERDASRKAKPFGWRLRGKGVYRKPTKAEIKSGAAYYEARPKKADVSRSTYPKLEDGGMMAKGGWTKNRKGEYRKQTKREIANDIKAGAAKKPGYRYSDVTGDRYFEDRPNRSDKSRKLKYDDGGMMSKDAMMNDGGYMAKGGWIKNRKGEYRKQTKAEIKNDIKAGAAKKPGYRYSDVTGDRYFEDRPNRSDKSRKLKY
jgi:hypothetical protein